MAAPRVSDLAWACTSRAPRFRAKPQPAKQSVAEIEAGVGDRTWENSLRGLSWASLCDHPTAPPRPGASWLKAKGRCAGPTGWTRASQVSPAIMEKLLV